MIRRFLPFAAFALIAAAVLLALPAAAAATSAFAQTNGVAVTGTTTATVLGIVNPENESTGYELQWDLGSSLWCKTAGTSDSAAHATPETRLDPSWLPTYLSIDLTGLTYGTSYCAELVATNADGEGDGGFVTWVESSPEVHTLDASATSATSAAVGGEINPHGALTFYRAEYDGANSDWCTSGATSGTPANSLDNTELGFTDDAFHPVSVKLFQLTPGETYCARLVAYSSGNGAGQLVTFTANLPAAETDTALSTGGSTATVTGFVNPSGTTTSYDVQYDVAGSNWCTSSGSSGSPAHSTDSAVLGFTDVDFHRVSVDLSGLAAGTDYCGRISATNANGDGDGSQLTWTEGTRPGVLTFDAYSTGSTMVTVEGFVNPVGEATTYQVEYDLADSTWCTSAGASGSPANTTAPSSDGLDPSNPDFQYVAVDLTGLVEGTDYCTQLIATDANGETQGGQWWWTQGTPTPETFDAFSTGDTTATVDGDINPAGKSTIYQVWYDVASSDWCQSDGAAGSPAHTTGLTALGFSDDTFHDVVVDLTGLSTSTDYCAEIVAANADGASEGGQLSWTQPTPPRTLTVSLNGSVKVTSSPAGIECGAGEFSGLTCRYSFAPGTQVTLTATHGSGVGLVTWSGCTSIGPTSTSVCNVTMSADKDVTATFKPLNSTLTVSKTGSGSGTVTSAPPGINCGSTCSQAFPVNSQVSLVATPAAGSSFTGWSSSDCSGTGTCTTTVALASGTTVTATFTANPPPKPVVCVVPKVKGKTLAPAKRAIRKHHCAVGKVTKVKAPAKLRYHVISQRPKPGKHLRKGSKIALKVAK